MGGSLRKFVKPKAYYNIERRAIKHIEKEKPIAAPKHQGTVSEDVYSNLDPQFFEKNEKLHSRMQKMYLESHGPAPEVKSKSRRPLPENRSQMQSSFDNYGYHIPSRTSQGKINYLQMLVILRKYSESKGEYTAMDISKEYKVDPVKIQNVLNYFQVLQVKMPPAKAATGSLFTTWETPDSEPEQLEQADPKEKVT